MFCLVVNHERVSQATHERMKHVSRERRQDKGTWDEGRVAHAKRPAPVACVAGVLAQGLGERHAYPARASH